MSAPPRYQPGTRVSEYVLQERLGVGTHSEVWRARHHIWDDAEVAAKLPIQPEYVRYLQREGLVAQHLRHPNIVRVLGFDPFAEIPYLILELVRGPSLRDVLAEHPRGVPVSEAVTILRGALQALTAAHDAGVVHRDLKPGNILIHLEQRPLLSLREEDVRVGDFGLGRAPEETALLLQSASLERDARVVGTLAYLAPELQDGHSAAEPRGDLYALGVVLFELLTGQRPNWAEVPSALRPDAPPELDEIFRKLCARIEQRYASARAVLEALDQAPATRPRARAVIPPPAPPPLPRTRGALRIICPRCRTQAEAGDQFCVECGMQLVADVRRCPACHGYPGPGDSYCIHCGTALGPAARSER